MQRPRAWLFVVVGLSVENDNNDTRDNEYCVYPGPDPGQSQPRTTQSPTSALLTRGATSGHGVNINTINTMYWSKGGKGHL